MKIPIVVLLFAFGTLAAAFSQEQAVEPSTGKKFPVTVTVAADQPALSLTGLAVRKKFVFKVYGMAHYAQDPPTGSASDVLKAILTDGKAKQITMDFARDVDGEKIHDAYADGFKENATKEELAKIQPLVDQFVGYFAKGVKENQQFVLRWLPGGVVSANLCGEEKPAITDPTFARILWTIWFGEHSIVDRDDLISRQLK
jgi:hypothetical protein